MNITDIMTFLSVAHSETISNAANTMYVSQSTISSRLQQLEEEIGTTLIKRRKGVRKIELTPKGKAFIPLAERWLSLHVELTQFHQQMEYIPLSIACPDSLNAYLLNRFFFNLSQDNTSLHLSVRTHQSPEIFSLIDSHAADIGFAFLLYRYSGVLCRPIFSEKMILLCSANGNWPDSPIYPAQLNRADELYLPWNQEFQFWHDKFWDPNIPPYIHVDLASMLALYLELPKSWTICPISVARAFLQSDAPVIMRELSEPIPSRTCYLLTSRQNASIKSLGIELFEQHLYGFLSSFNEIELITDPAVQKAAD